MDEEILKSALADLVRGQPITQIREIFTLIMSGQADPIQMAAFLTALHIAGESAQEISAAAQAMRAAMLPVALPNEVEAIDVCGTGGDMKSTLNISTAVALVVAACGVCVAKHGNRAQSSQSGSADLLEALGVRLDPVDVEASIKTIGIGFMFAQHHHPAMKYVAPVRRKLGFRTIFNLLGPLCNPARVRRQLIGVFDKKWLPVMAEALQQLGCEHAWIVHSADGMDELSTTGLSYVVELKQGVIKAFELHPESLGLALAQAETLRGGDVKQNQSAFERLLQGEKSPYRDIVLLNSAAALLVAGKVETLQAGLALAQTGLDERAAGLLQQWIKFSNE